MMMSEKQLNLPLRLLHLLAYGGIRSTAELAQQLGISEGLVTLMAEDLTRRGYLVALSAGGECKAGCAGCAVAATCSTPTAQDRLPLLALTAKGKMAVPV